ncbi:hypothetical protein OEB99_19150 [Actinotalea sp. M2MS4P-6]|uniref:hypothetical protein n=1 Tax=Actinotalea sp. M2MS4P-6 TaxID=2983762 RepID=UPI0021E49979|nr:hypothetical protein [Actinotalea sp. M2MS4P-6]MCV2396434.1 hypothetical protein [Actinotalea sp. M2MS4P-6]
MPTTERAQWRWSFRNRSDESLDRPVSPVFTSRFDAESWLGEHWRGLVSDHVARAQLLEGETKVGSPVELRAA